MRTGDHVHHKPSGEDWLVAWADHSAGYMAPCGWPTCQARIEDCEVTKTATDQESDALVEQLARSGRSDAQIAAAIRALKGGGVDG